MRIPLECRVFLSALSRLLAADEREDWLREWQGEVWHWWASSPQDADARIELWKHCWGAVYDARYLRRNPGVCWRPEFALAMIAALLVLVVAASGGLHNTRRLLRGLAYPAANRIATVSQPGRLIAREGVPTGKIPAWREQVEGLEAIEGYWWSPAEIDCAGRRRKVMRARVTPGFFPLLGQARVGLVAQTAVLRASLARECRSVAIEGRAFHVIGTVPDSFWFLDDRIEMWTLLPPERVNSWRLAGAVVRLDPARVGEVQERMRRVASSTGFWPTGRHVEIAPLAPRVGQPLRFYGWIWVAGVCAAAAWFVWGDRTRRGAFWGVQFVLLTLAVALAVLEFTGASYVGMYGGAAFAGEPGAIWLFVLGWCGALWYSIADRRMRCRECLGRLQMPARIGLPGNLLFGAAGREMVCLRGHGTLYVDEKPENVHEPDRWIRLDESWRDLFARR